MSVGLEETDFCDAQEAFEQKLMPSLEGATKICGSPASFVQPATARLTWPTVPGKLCVLGVGTAGKALASEFKAKGAPGAQVFDTFEELKPVIEENNTTNACVVLGDATEAGVFTVCQDIRDAGSGMTFFAISVVPSLDDEGAGWESFVQAQDVLLEQVDWDLSVRQDQIVCVPDFLTAVAAAGPVALNYCAWACIAYPRIHQFVLLPGNGDLATACNGKTLLSSFTFSQGGSAPANLGTATDSLKTLPTLDFLEPSRAGMTVPGPADATFTIALVPELVIPTYTAAQGFTSSCENITEANNNLQGLCEDLAELMAPPEEEEEEDE